GGRRQVPHRHQLLRRRRRGQGARDPRQVRPQTAAPQNSKPVIDKDCSMTDLHKRSLFKLAALGAATAALVACGKKDEPAPAPAAAPAEPAAAAPAPANQPLKIGFAYVGPVGDGGWSFAHDQARKKLEAEFGDKIQTTFVESVPEGPDAERVLRDLVTQGNKMIFGTTFGYMDVMQKL